MIDANATIALQSSKASNYTCRGPRSTQDIKGGKMNRKHGPSGLYRMASALGRLCTCNKMTAIQTNPLSQLFMHTHLFSSLLPLSLAHSPNNSLSFWVYSLGKTYPLQLFMVCRLKLLSLWVCCSTGKQTCSKITCQTSHLAYKGVGQAHKKGPQTKRLEGAEELNATRDIFIVTVEHNQLQRHTSNPYIRSSFLLIDKEDRYL